MQETCYQKVEVLKPSALCPITRIEWVNRGKHGVPYTRKLNALQRQGGEQFSFSWGQSLKSKVRMQILKWYAHEYVKAYSPLGHCFEGSQMKMT